MTPRTSARAVALTIGLVTLAMGVGGALAAPPAAPDDRILPPGMHQTEKARGLASRHQDALRDLNTEVYWCMPWVEVDRQSIGFFKPKGAPQDDRYLSITIEIEQEPSPDFARLSFEQRASAMFSRYAGAMLRRMTRHADIVNDDAIGGYNVILKWMKQVPRTDAERPVLETIAVFMEKVDADEYLSGRMSIRELASHARVLAWDGITALGRVRVAGWEDNFVSTYQVKGYEPDPSVACAK